MGKIFLFELAGLAAFCVSGASATTMAEAEGPKSGSAEIANPAIYTSSIGASSAAVSEDSSSGWQFAVTPYLWASGMEVDIQTAEGEEAHVDDSFFDILDDLKFAFMGSFEARRGRFVTVHDLLYISTGSSADGSIGPIPVEADVEEKLLVATHLVGYRLVDEGPMSLDLMAGARITSIKIDLTLRGPVQEIRRDNSKTTVGPVIASRFRMPLGGKWTAALYGDVGGFGVAADISWQVLGTVKYDLSDHWGLLAGWRHLSAQQDKNDFDVDMVLDGPVFAATYRF